VNALLDAAALRPRSSPFDLDDESAYLRWRAGKLAQRARSADDLIADVGNPQALTVGERDALVQRCARWNMVVYRSARGIQDKDTPLAAGRTQCKTMARMRCSGGW
jgi:hypothetical protein